MRMIDADALMESIRKALGIKSMTKSLLLPAERTKIDQIYSAPTIGGWISVKDQLPKPPAQCLVYSAKASRPRGMETATYTGLGWMTAAYFPGITHWMPLPEPPKEGKHE